MKDFIQFEYTAKKTQIENCYRQLILYNYFSGKKNFLYPLFPLFLHTMNRKYQCYHRKYWCYYYDHTTMNIEFSNTTVRCFTLSARFAQTQQPPLDSTHSQNHFTPNSPIKIDLSSTCIKIMIFSLIFIFNNKNKM